jgi:TIR domain
VPGTAFISYSHTDRKYVHKLTSRLRDAGIPVWSDHAVEVGEQFDELIQRQIDNCSVLLVVLTPESAASKWVLREVKYADQSDVPILPLLLKPCDIPIRLSGILYEDVTGGRLPSESTIGRLRRLTGTSREVAPEVDLSGHWVGQQIGNSIPMAYRLHLSQHGSAISGTARGEVTGKEPSGHRYVIFELTGNVYGRVLDFEQTSILDSSPVSSMYWCLIRASLTYSKSGKAERLAGNYSEASKGNPNAGCRDVSGTLDLRRDWNW